MQINLITLGMISGTVFKYLALIMIIWGYCLRYWINNRRFNRRNFAGLEGFKSYTEARFVRLAERIGKFIGALLMIGGVLFFLLLWLGQPKKKVEKSNAATELNKKSD